MKLRVDWRAGLITGALGILVSTLSIQQPATADLGSITASPPISATFYLAFTTDVGKSGPGRLLTIQSTLPALLEHLREDKNPIRQVLVYDDRGRELAVGKNGHARFSNNFIDDATAATHIDATFAAVRHQAAREVLRKPAKCASIRKSVLKLLTPLTQDADGQPLPLNIVAQDASRRIDEIHHLEQAVPLRCFRSPGSHARGYLHNLWHRITRTS